MSYCKHSRITDLEPKKKAIEFDQNMPLHLKASQKIVLISVLSYFTWLLLPHGNLWREPNWSFSADVIKNSKIDYENLLIINLYANEIDCFASKVIKHFKEILSLEVPKVSLSQIATRRKCLSSLNF